MTEPEPIPAPAAAERSAERQGAGFRLIIGYKFAKAALMFGVALWLTTAPGAAFRTLETLARELAEGGAVFGRAGHWIQAHLTNTFVLRGALLAWLDSLSGAIEGFLLLSGKPWAHWIVILSLAALLPFEVLSLEHRPGAGKIVVLLANALIVAYLARGQLLRARTHG